MAGPTAAGPTTGSPTASRPIRPTKTLLSPEEAWARLESVVGPLGGEPLALRGGQALGRVLVRGVTATVDVPASDVSAMDGFALAGAPGDTVLEVAGLVAAGDPPGAALTPGRPLRIMTGAPVPAGADRVIPVERAEVVSEGVPPGTPGERVRFLEAGRPGDHIRRAGEVSRRGEPLLAAGARLTPGALSLLATHGVGYGVGHGSGHGDETVEVHRLPRVAWLVTGDEVVPPVAEPGPGQLRDSHGAFLAAATDSLGLGPLGGRHLGIAGDREGELRRGLEAGLAEADVLLVTGGVSMGERDLVGLALAELGCETLFHGVAVQPGKPLMAARGPADTTRKDGRRALVFGLPGNPASVMVCFWLFVAPALRRLAGLGGGYRSGLVAGTLAAPLPRAKGRDKYLPADLEWVGGRALVTPHPPVGSHDLVAYARGSALVRIPALSEPAEAGEACEVLPLGG